MKIFDYIYYKLTHFFYITGEKDADIPANCFLSLCQAINIITIIPFLISIKINNWLIIIIITSTIAFNGLYSFSKKRVVRFEKRWKNETKTMKYIGGGLTILYIVASFTLWYFAMGYYKGYTNWKWDL